MLWYAAFFQRICPISHEWRICITRRHYLLSVLCRARQQRRERERERKQARKRARERGRERDTTQLCRWSLRVRNAVLNAQCRRPLYHLQSLKNCQHFCCHFRAFRYWIGVLIGDRNSRPRKISIFNVKVKEHRWFWRWRNEPPVRLKGKFVLSYFVSCFPSREYEPRLIRGGLRKMCWHLPF